MSFEIVMRDCAAHEDQRQRESAIQYAAEDSATRQTLTLAQRGDYSRLLDAMDYRDNDAAVMRALVACANLGDAYGAGLARKALDQLARTWAETHTETDL